MLFFCHYFRNNCSLRFQIFYQRLSIFKNHYCLHIFRFPQLTMPYKQYIAKNVHNVKSHQKRYSTTQHGRCIMVSMFSKLNACISPECYLVLSFRNTTIYFSDITRPISVYTYTIHTGAENTTIVQPVCLHKWFERNRIPRILPFCW